MGHECGIIYCIALLSLDLTVNSESIDHSFQPQQIVCIDRAELRLFAEVIQLLPERDRCWAKPLVLGRSDGYELEFLHDMREAPQLLLPISFFRVAIDTEVLPLLTELWNFDKASDLADEELSRQALHQFVRSLPFKADPSAS
jgi:hypothetical protein